MNSEDQQWQEVKENYLKLIEKNLARVDHPQRSDILANVREHLDNKYAELTSQQKNWESYQQIITEMGPPEEYAELLNVDTPEKQRQFGINTLLAVIFVVVLAAVGSYLIYTAKETPVPKAYIITFEPVSPFDPQTARELLTAFNKDHPSGVRTHHYRTKIEDKELVGLICVDSKPDAEAVKKMLERSDTLEFINTKAVTQQEFKEYCQQKQVSLSSSSASVYDQISQSPVIFVNDLPVDGIVINKPDCTADFIQSRLGPPVRIDADGKMLRYTNHGIDLWFSGNKHLSEVHLNRGFKGKLDTGISMRSTMQDVFDAYGQPTQKVQAPNLHSKNDDRILYQKGDISRIYYDEYGLIFWFRGNEISQIVPFRGQMKSSDSTPASPPNSVEFELDERVLGKWVTVDLVRHIDDFKPNQKSWQDELFLKELTFEDNGILWWTNVDGGPYRHHWTKGKVNPDKTHQASYFIESSRGNYMFFEWISGDVTIRGQKPCYYVLKKVE